MSSSTKRSISPGAEEILGKKFRVLDQGFVSLIDYMGTDVDIEAAARVSYGNGTRKTSETEGLIRYLRRHYHNSPTEMVELKFHCSMPIFVARQWVRHRTASLNEVSGRYSILPTNFYTPPQEQLTGQSSNNKQGRTDQPLPADIQTEAYLRWAEGRAMLTENYEWLTANGVARELARIDLPLSTYTQWYWKIDLHNLLHFLTLRVDKHAQWEIQQYGKVMAGMLKRLAPMSYRAWIDYDVCGVRLSRMEMNAVKKLIARFGNAIGCNDYLSDFEDNSLGEEYLIEQGMSKRECSEFLDLFPDKEKYMKEHPGYNHFEDPPEQVPDFELDLTKEIE